jgi:hypothetical protein
MSRSIHLIEMKSQTQCSSERNEEIFIPKRHLLLSLQGRIDRRTAAERFGG